MVNITTLEGKKVKCVLWERIRTVQGVITGVSIELTTVDIMRNVMGYTWIIHGYTAVCCVSVYPIYSTRD